MARPLPTGKKTVNLTTPVRVSRIRRDPPPPVKKVDPRERDQRDTKWGMIGVVAIALALFIIMFALGSVIGWSPRQYTIHL